MGQKVGQNSLGLFFPLHFLHMQLALRVRSQSVSYHRGGKEPNSFPNNILIKEENKLTFVLEHISYLFAMERNQYG